MKYFSKDLFRLFCHIMLTLCDSPFLLLMHKNMKFCPHLNRPTSLLSVSLSDAAFKGSVKTRTDCMKCGGDDWKQLKVSLFLSR